MGHTLISLHFPTDPHNSYRTERLETDFNQTTHHLMANTICVGTRNVRGLNNKLKRRTLFNYLRRHKVNIAYLQETCIKSDTIHDIKREWRVS